MKKTTPIRKKILSFVTFIILILTVNLSYSQVLEVRGNNVVIANGDITPSLTDFTDFGSVPSGNKFARSFVLKNTGSSSLTFPASNAVTLTGVDAGQFSITTSIIINPKSLTPNTYTIIDISFNPTSTGLKTATLTIDPSNGSPATYVFTIQGTGTAAVTPDFTMSLLKPNNSFNAPYELIYAPDNYLWLTERVGKKINRVNPADGTVDLLLDLSSIVYRTGGQDGLLGMVLHPNFGKGTGEDYVYISYTYSTTGSTTDDTTRRTKLVRYTYSITGNDGSLSSPLVLIEGLSGSNDHNSGKLRIGPDNKLYYTIGDQGHNQSTTSNACKPINSQVLPTQGEIDVNDYSSYEGKILRLNLDGSIPVDNPTLNSVKSHIYSYGHRNPQGLVFGKNGKLYSSEHGPKSDDEINLIQSGGNYGWPNVNGYLDDKNYVYCNWSSIAGCNPAAFSEYTCGAGATSITESGWGGTFTPPITTFYTLDDGYNFTGGYLSWPTVAPSSTRIYEGMNSEIPGWDNSLITTTLKRGEIYRSKLSADGSTIIGESEALLYTQNRYRDIAFDPDGKTIYIITDSSGQTTGQSGSQPLAITNPGTILKFVYQPSLITCDAPVPDITNLPDITDQCSVTSITAPTATNACSGTIIGTTNTIFPITAQGTTIVTWTYSYGNGNTVTQTQNVIIDDTVAPVIPTLSDLTAQCSATPVAPTTTDACAGTITGTTSTVFPITAQGTTVVTWTFDDGNGQSVTANQNIIIDDTVAPISITKNITITVGSTITENDIDNGSSDNCGISTMSLSKYTFNTVGIETITLTVTDFKGNFSSETAQVTVENTLGTGINTKNNLFVIYPIPFNNQINIDFPKSYLGNTAYIQIYNMNGKMIYDKKHIINNNRILIDNLSLYSNGNYFIYLLDENQKMIQKYPIIKN